MRNSDLHIEEQDDLGPGSDLVISLFAAAILLLGMVGVGYKLETARVRMLGGVGTTNAALKSELDKLKGENERLRAENNRRSAEIEQLRATRERLIAELATYRTQFGELSKQQTAVRKDGVGLEQKIVQLEQANAGLKERNTTLEENESKLEEQVGNAKKMAEELQWRLTAALNSLAAEQENERAHTRAIFELKESKNLSPFKKNSADLTSDAQQIVVSRLVESRPDIIKQVANLLLIEGYASPEPIGAGGGRDGNLDLSNARANTVAYFLIARGVPFQCVASVGYGRSRSKFLMSYLSDGNRTLGEWDMQFRNNEFRSNLEEKYGDVLSAERRVVLRAVHDPLSTCTPNALAMGLRRLE